jgi:hypothetical protein
VTVLKHALPRPHIGYHDAMRSWFVLNDGSVHCVEMANSLDLLLFLLCSSVRRKGFTRVNMKEVMSLLTDDDCGLSRWHCINSMMEGYIKLPLYDSAEDAKSSQMSYTTE